MQIAVLVDKEGNVTSFEKGGNIEVYDVSESGSHLMRHREYISVADKGAAAIRSSLTELNEWLSECRVVVSDGLKGIYFMMLEGLGFNLWEMTGKPLEFLDYIYRGEAAEQEKANQPEKKYAPLDKGRGVFFIDLENVQREDSIVSSKEVLLPFLQKEDFKKLEVKCGHVPRWFDSELAPLKLRAIVEKQEKGCLVSITHESL
jgi:Fe-only nitrogenase accessory protein AnfO